MARWIHATPTCRSLRSPIPFAVAVALAACGGDDDPTGPPDPTDPPPIELVTVTLSPTTATVDQGGTTNFTATVTGTQNTAVTWTTSAGTISAQGNTATLTAPASAGSVTVTATSVADSTRSASAGVTVPEVAIALSVSDATLLRYEEREISATVTGTVNTDVHWEGSCDELDIDGDAATLTAPGTPGICEVTATSIADPTKSASTTFTISADLFVNVNDDVDDGRCDPTHCSLREALAVTASEAAAEGIAGVIRFEDALTGETITLESALPDITWEVSLAGPGADDLTIDAGADEDRDRRIFTIIGGTVTIEGLALTGGYARIRTDGPVEPWGGGAINASAGAEVVLRGASVRDNVTESYGGGVFVWGFSRLIVADTRFDGNESAGGGGFQVSGGSYAEITESAVSDNVSSRGGGGIRVDAAELVVRRSVVTRNSAAGFGGGGVIVTGVQSRLHMEDFLVEENRLDGTESGLQIVGGGGLSVYNGAALTLVRGEIRDNESTMRGGGLYHHAGHAEIVDIVVRGNRSGIDGGGILAEFPLAPRYERVTIVDNDGGTGAGGGIAMASPSLQEGSFINATISGNRASFAAGAFLGATMRLVNVTIAGNESTPDGAIEGSGILVAFQSGTNPPAVRFTNVLMAGNLSNGTLRNCLILTPPGGPFVSDGNNLSDDESCADWLDDDDDLHGVDAGLDAELADNGGLTPTHALLEGSAAIGAGNPATCPATDQRGAARDNGCDIGAFQFGATAPMIQRYISTTPGAWIAPDLSAVPLHPVGALVPLLSAGTSR